MTMEPVKVEAIECPGFDAVNGKHFTCGELSRGRARANIIRPGTAPCERCTRQRSKYDEEHGLRVQRELAESTRYKALIELYVADLSSNHDWSWDKLGTILHAVDGLKARSTWSPHNLGGQVEPIPESDKLNVLRSLAGLPIIGRGRLFG